MTILDVISSSMVVKNPRKDSIVLSGDTPGNFFDSHNAAAATVDAPHRVQKEDEKPPQGDELKAPFGELVVTGAPANGSASRLRPNSCAVARPLRCSSCRH